MSRLLLECGDWVNAITAARAERLGTPFAAGSAIGVFD